MLVQWYAQGSPRISSINTRTSRALAVLAVAEIQEESSKTREHRVLHLRTVTLPDHILRS